MADPADEMHIDPARAKTLASNLSCITRKVDAARGSRKVRLIAVSKLKPASDVLALHQAHQPSSSADMQQQLDFGENYTDELTAKAALLPRSIRWHMIGALQTNKCKPLAATVPNLYCVSSVDTAKKADALDKGRSAALAQIQEQKQNQNQPASQPPTPSTADPHAPGNPPGDDDNSATAADQEPLRILVQVNTSGEASKSGTAPGAPTTELCRHVREQCPHLRLAGLMTIGALARSQAVGADSDAETENPDFAALREARDLVARELGMEKGELELSMGMSADFEAAVRAGSDEVRVGTGIFGERPARKEASVR